MQQLEGPMTTPPMQSFQRNGQVTRRSIFIGAAIRRNSWFGTP
jgi:hypothetical protein